MGQQQLSEFCQLFVNVFGEVFGGKVGHAKGLESGVEVRVKFMDFGLGLDLLEVSLCVQFSDG